jgi:subtilisin family serine protease
LIVVGGSEGRNATDADARWYDSSINRGSNYGPSIDLFAPARNVRVATWVSATATSDPNDENESTGTSFAAPLVAGAAARHLQPYGNESHSMIETRLITNATTDGHGLNLLNRLNSPNRLLYMPYGCRTQAVGH